MGFFNKKQIEKENISSEEQIVEIIKNSDSMIDTFYDSMIKLPEELIDWADKQYKKQIKETGSCINIEIVDYLHLLLKIAPADIIIRKNDNPVKDDIIEIFYETDENEIIHFYQKILKINTMDSHFVTCDLDDPDNKYTIQFKNVMNTIKIIKYGTDEYNKIIELFNIEIDKNLQIETIKEIIEIVKKENDEYMKQKIEILEKQLTLLNEK